MSKISLNARVQNAYTLHATEEEFIMYLRLKGIQLLHSPKNFNERPLLYPGLISINELFPNSYKQIAALPATFITFSYIYRYFVKNIHEENYLINIFVTISLFMKPNISDYMASLLSSDTEVQVEDVDEACFRKDVGMTKNGSILSWIIFGDAIRSERRDLTLIKAWLVLLQSHETVGQCLEILLEQNAMSKRQETVIKSVKKVLETVNLKSDGNLIQTRNFIQFQLLKTERANNFDFAPMTESRFLRDSNSTNTEIPGEPPSDVSKFVSDTNPSPDLPVSHAKHHSVIMTIMNPMNVGIIKEIQAAKTVNKKWEIINGYWCCDQQARLNKFGENNNLKLTENECEGFSNLTEDLQSLLAPLMKAIPALQKIQQQYASTGADIGSVIKAAQTIARNQKFTKGTTSRGKYVE